MVTGDKRIQTNYFVRRLAIQSSAYDSRLISYIDINNLP
jgi:hypothetical protein